LSLRRCAPQEAALVGVPGVAIAQSASQIVVEGNRRVEAETIRSYFALAPGERLDAAKIDAALKALYAARAYSRRQITPSGGRVIVVVIQRGDQSRRLRRQSQGKDEQLQAEVQSRPRGHISRAIVQAGLAQRIIEIYQHGGRYDVRVEPKIIELPNGRVDLVFEISEGAKTGVAKINFVGNNAFCFCRAFFDWYNHQHHHSGIGWLTPGNPP
jgi:outer membrane protein insertion porin family